MREDGLSKTRRKVQEAVEKAEAEHRRQLLAKRIELANTGLNAYRGNRPVEAVKAFQMYLRILEDWKGVAEGSLNPGLFDSRKDAAELLLLSGVYWDLVRLYDRTKTETKRREFLHYLEKYILFSKGARHQGLCAEALRKYISTDRPRHVDDFRNAYKVLAMHKCFVATELCDLVAIDTIPALRGFRDGTLRRSRGGRAFIGWYYRNGPGLARFMALRSPRVRKLVAKGLDLVARLISRSILKKRL